jgi:hypothetical protein
MNVRECGDRRDVHQFFFPQWREETGVRPVCPQVSSRGIGLQRRRKGEVWQEWAADGAISAVLVRGFVPEGAIRVKSG